MDLPFDLWHLAFVTLIQRRAPPNFEVRSEVRLTIEPQRADLLLLRRIGVERQDDRARVVRRLWPLLGLVTVREYKSPVDSAFRPGDLLRLVGYGVLYDTVHLDELPQREDLTLVLVVASITPNLLKEIKRMGWGRLLVGREIKHVLLLHVGVADADAIDDLLTAYEREGVRWIDLPTALGDPFYAMDPGPPVRYGASFPYYAAKGAHRTLPAKPIFASDLEGRLERTCR